MQEEFEKTVRERMHTFGIQPSHQVWDEIDAVLNKKKHRRVFVGWWILLGLVVMGGAILLYEKDTVNRDGLNQQPLINADTANNYNLTQKPALTQPENDNKATAQTKNKTTQVNKKIQQAKPVSSGIADNDNNAGGTLKPKNAIAGKSSFTFNKHLPAVITPGVVTDQLNTQQENRKEIASPRAVAEKPIAETPNINPNAGLDKAPKAILKPVPGAVMSYLYRLSAVKAGMFA